MNLTQTSNPFFGEKTFSRAGQYSDNSSMTLNGTINKTSLVVLMVFASAYVVWQKFFTAFNTEMPAQAIHSIRTYMMIGGIGGFIVAMIASFNPRRSGFFTPIYAILEGLFLGGLSAMFEAQYPGLIVRAVAITFLVFLSMLFVYRQQIIKVTSKFRRGIVSALMGLMFFYLVSWIAGMFGANVSYLSGGGSFGLIFSLIVSAISAFSLLLDFDFIEKGAAAGAPKYMEWYAVFGLLVSLVWLYVNILRLLSIFAQRD